MRHWAKWPLIVVAFVFGLGFALVGDGLTSQTHFPATPLVCGWEYVQIEGRTNGRLVYRLMPRRKPGLDSTDINRSWEAACFARETYLLSLKQYEQSLKNYELLRQILKNQAGGVKDQQNSLPGDILNSPRLGLWVK